MQNVAALKYRGSFWVTAGIYTREVQTGPGGGFKDGWRVHGAGRSTLI